MKRSIKALLAFFVLAVLGLGLIEILWRPCSGLSDCYFSWRLFWGKTDIATREKELLISQFAASAKLVVFPAILEGGSTGLIVFDRVSQKAKVISEERAGLFAPFLSVDGERLLFMKHSVGRDIVSCSTESWRCEALVHTEDTVFSPTEISKDAIVYASSPLVTGLDKRQRYNRNDVIAVAKGGKRSRITSLGYYSLDSISVTENSVFLSGTNGPYEIFRSSLPQLDEGAIVPISPSVFLEPSSIPVASVSASPDGQFVSFRKAETVRGKYDYNLNVVNLAGKPLGIAKVDGIAMSRGTFIDRKLLFNELYSDNYIVRQWDFLNDTSVNIAEIPHESSRLKLLERISLVTEQRAIQ